MAEIDELSISIKASTHEAVTSIDKLIQTLGNLSNALNISGVDGFVNSMERIAKTIDSINTENLDKLALSTKSLAKYTKNLSMVGTGAKQAGDSVSKLGKELAGDLGISDKNAISQLQKSLHEFFSSKDNQSMSKAHDNIMRIAQAYMRIDGKANEAKKSAVAFLDALKNRKLNLPKEWTKEYGDVGEGRRYRTMIGPLKQTVRSGGSDAEEVAKDLGINDYNNAQDAFQKIALRAAEARETIKQADNEMLSYAEALREGGSAANEANAALEMLMQKLANFVKMTPENMQKAMNPAYSTTSQKDLEEQRAALGQFSVMADHMQSIGNPFENVATGLRELSAIQISDTLANLNYLKDAVSKVGGESGMRAGAAMRDIASGLEALNVPVPPIGEELGSLAAGLRALGSGNVVTASQTLPFLAEGITQLNAVQLDPTKAEAIGNLANAVKQFGYAKTENAIVNLPVLATELSKLINTLAKAPAVSNSTIELIKAIGNLNMKTGALAPATTRAAKGLNLFSNNAKKAHKPAFSLAAAIGKVYATYWALFRVMGMFKNSIDLASDLTEVQNVVDHTFGQMKDRMEDFAKSAVETVGMSELTAKQIASRFQSMGRNMGIPESAIKSTNDFVNSATNGYSGVADSMADVSINLTKLAGDMASFYNLPYEDVAEDMEAIFTGQTRPLRKYGLDLTQATLKEWALANGMNADIKSMTQAEKTLLRYQYVMANTTAAQGDFERTIGTWANQIKLAQENLKRLQIILGQIGINTFKPLVVNFNSAMNDIIHLAESTFNALGTIFGWHIEISDVGILDDMADGLEDVEDGYDAAGDSAKKFKNFLLGIDELNLLPDNSDKGKGSGDADALGALSNGLQDSMVNFEKTEGMFDSLYDTLFKLGARIGEVEKEWLKGIDWDGVYDKARDFAKGLADFLNGYFSDAELFYEKGKFIANGINTVANAIDEFFKRFNGWQFGVDIGTLINGFTENLDWATINSAATEMAYDIASAINGAFQTIKFDDVGKTIGNAFNTAIDFLYTIGDTLNWQNIGDSISEAVNSAFDTFDFKKASATLNKWAKGLLDAMIRALKKTNWKLVGEKIGDFISGIDVITIAGKLSQVLAEVFEAAVEIWIGSFKSAPIETALITAFAIPFSSGQFKSNISRNVGKLTAYFGNCFSSDLGKLFNGDLRKAFRSGLETSMSEGFNAVSGQISTFTKTVGSIGVVAGEFVALKDAVYECVSGTGDIGENILQIVGAVGLATPALTALLGVPGGLILVGAGAAAGAVVGIQKAFEELAEDNVISRLTKDYADAGITLDDIARRYKETADNITGGIDKMNEQHDRLSGMKGDLSEMLGGFELIKQAAESGALLTSDALEELVGDLEAVKKAWEDYINSQYDWLIQSTINNMTFISNSRALTEDEKNYFVERINALTQAKQEGVQAAGEAMQELEDAWNDYNNLIANPIYDDRGFATTLGLDEARKRIDDAALGVLGLANATGILSGDAQEVEKSILGIRDAAAKLDFSNIDPSNLENFGTKAEDINRQIQSTYDSAKDSIDEYVRNLESSGQYTASQLAMETGEYYRRLSEETTANLDFIQKNMFDQFYENIESGNIQEAKLYAEKVIKPFIDSFPEVLDEEGNRIKPVIEDAINEVFDNAFEGDSSNRMAAIREKYFGTGELLGDAFSEGVLESVGAAEVTMENFGKTSAYAFGSTERSMKNFIQNGDAVRDAILKMQDEFDKASSKAGDMKGSLDNLSSSFGATKEKINNIKTFDGVKKSTDEVVTGFDKIKNISSEVASALSISLGEMSGEFSTVFTNISSDTDVFINQFKGDLTNLFSADTWSGMLSGIPNTFRAMWDNTIKVMKTMWNDFAQWINNNATIEIPKTKVGNTEIGGANIRLKVPRFDVGGSIPNDGSLFVANERGAEVVANMGSRTGVMNTDQMKAAIREGMVEALTTSGQNVNVYLNGDAATFFTAMVKENNSSIMRTGSSPLRV